MTQNRTNAVYARQSIDRAESVSIAQQFEACEYELKGERYQPYEDRGYSGKNTDRPAFQKLLRDIEAGLISKVAVYRLDRFSRSLLDFAELMKFFKKHKVKFVSSKEKFDTSTAMGRAMLNLCMVFAELERETIQQRIQDAWYSRMGKGIPTGGQTPFGFRSEPCTIDGIKARRLIIDPKKAEFVKLMYEMYADPQVSLGDITKELTKSGLETAYGNLFSKQTVKAMLINPVYVKADLDIYNFYKNHGTKIVNGADDFIGTNGCYYYKGKNVENSKYTQLKGQQLVIAPHEGFIESDLWLQVRKKFLANPSFRPARKPHKSWLLGKLKCGRCGYGLRVNGNHFQCGLRVENNGCVGCGTIRLNEIQDLIYAEMVKKLRDFITLTNQTKALKINPKLTQKKLEVAKIDSEIENLLAGLKLLGAKAGVHINAEFEKLDEERQALMQEISVLTLDEIPPAQLETISNHLDEWDNVSFEDRLKVVDYLITRIGATSTGVEIEWKI
jgi:DNA invertase Pin-like site-specific DNA recombinase